MNKTGIIIALGKKLGEKHGKEDEEEEVESADGSVKQELAQDIIDAIKKDDAEALVEALEAFMMECE